MEKALLDTDILSEVMKARSQAVLSRAAAYNEQYDRFTVSAVTVMEIIKGLQRVGRRDALARFVDRGSALEILPFDAETAEIAGRIYGDLERTGQPTGRADPMIAATAIQHMLVLVTGNQRHFERIRKLGYEFAVEDWRD